MNSTGEATLNQLWCFMSEETIKLITHQSTTGDSPLRQLISRKWLIALSLLFGIGVCTYLKIHNNPQRQARLQVEKLGGWTGRAHSFWQVFGIRLPIRFDYGNTVQLVLDRPSITDEDVIPILLALPDLDVVKLDYSQISDDTLNALPERGISELSLVNTPVSDDGMRAVAMSCTYHCSVDLTGTEISDVGLKELENVSDMGRIKLSGTKITDAGFLSFVRNGPTCVIDVRGTDLSPEAVEQARQIKAPNLIQY